MYRVHGTRATCVRQQREPLRLAGREGLTRNRISAFHPAGQLGMMRQVELFASRDRDT
jgi:hypothetical protein